MLCLGCDPEWEKYYDVIDGEYVLKLSTDTCDALVEGCKEWIEENKEMKEKFDEFAKEIDSVLENAVEGYEEGDVNTEDITDLVETPKAECNDN